MTRDALDGLQDASLQDPIDMLCDRFEAEWRGGKRPSLTEFVRQAAFAAEDLAGNVSLLRQLIAIDLWYCWGQCGTGETTSVLTLGDTPRQGVAASTVVSLPARPLLDDYVRCFPELGSVADLPDDLIVREYEARCRQKEAPDSAEYVRRFGARPELADMLRELESDRRTRPPDSKPAGVLLGRGAGQLEGGSGGNLAHPGLGECREFGEYDILEQIGHGGMGVVYKAWQRTANRVVALKMILAGQLAGPEEVQRFYAEARAAARLDHRHIVPLYEVGQQDGQPYFSMGFVDGPTLKRRLADGPLGGRDAARLLEKIARAIDYAHEQGVIHRDLKPANVLLDQHGEPRVTDFGLAKQLDVVNELTITGQVIGTASYMPPEQAAGKTAQVGPHSDVYSLGAVLYEVLTGRPPFQGAGVYETLNAVQHQEPVAPRALNRAIPRDLETICLKCLQKDARQRYRSARDLADDLQRFSQGEPIRARPVALLEAGWRWCRRKPIAASLIAMSLLAVLAAGVGAAYRQQSVYDRRLLASSERERETARELACEKARLAELRQYFGLLAQARETVLRRRPGWTAAAMKHLAEAARLRPAGQDPAELRSLSAQCLAGFDLLPDQVITLAEGFEAGAVAFSPDGRYVAAGQLKSDWAPAVFVYEVETRRKAFEFRFAHPLTSLRRWVQGDRKYQEGVWSLAFSSDSKQLAAGTRFGRVCCWQLGPASRAREYTVFEETEEVQGLAFSPDNRWLFASSPSHVKGVLLDGSAGGGPLDLGRAERGRFAAGVESLVTFDGDGAQIRDVLRPETVLPARLPRCVEPALSPDGRRLAAVEVRGEENNRVTVYDVATGSKVRLLADPRDVRPGVDWRDPRLTFGPGGSLVFGHDEEGRVYAWDAASGHLLLNALLGEFRLGRYAVDPRGRYLAFAGRDRTALVPVHRSTLMREVAWQTSAIGSVGLSGDGRSVLCATAQQLRPGLPLTKRLLFSRHALSGEGRAEETAAFLPFHILPGNMPYAAHGDLAASPHGALAALAVPLAGVYLWDIEAGRVAPAIAPGSSGRACQFLEEDRLEIRGGRAQASVVEDAAAVNGRALRIVAGPERCEVHAGYAQLEAAGGGGDWVFVAVAKVRGGKPGCEWIETVSAWPDGTSRRPVPEGMVPRDAYHLFCLGWTGPDDAPETHGLAVLPGVDEGAEVWIDRIIAVPAGNMKQYKWKDAFGPLAFSRDAERLSSLVFTRRLDHWRMPDLNLSSCWDHTQAAESSGLGYLQALDLGRQLALAGGRDGAVHAISAGKLEQTWPPLSSAVVAVQLNSDESWAVVGTQHGDCRIARVPRGEPIADLAGHHGSVRALALSADDQWLATGDEEGTLRLWQRAGESFSLWLELPFSGPIRALRMTSDRSLLAVLVEGETAIRVLDWAKLEERLRELGRDAE